LHYASFYGYEDIVKLLISNKDVELEVVNKDDHSPVSICCSYQYISPEKKALKQSIIERIQKAIVKRGSSTKSNRSHTADTVPPTPKSEKLDLTDYISRASHEMLIREKVTRIVIISSIFILSLLHHIGYSDRRFISRYF
jgi:hypothetical protein